ncbi:MAG: LysM domain-containing protein [Chloroflexota bacterium]
MRRLTLLLTALLLAAAFTTVAFVVRAQDDPAPADDLASQLPITEDVQYRVGTGDTLDTIAALFDIDLACLIETNADVLTSGDTIFPGDVLLISADCPVYVGSGFVPFRRDVAIEQGGGNGTYVVRPGDTLDEIAFSFDISVESLIEFNEITNPLEIFPGDVLAIPPAAPPYGQVPARAGAVLLTEQGGGGDGEGNGITYVIQPGDTIDAIGLFFDKSAACIVETNNVENTRRIQPRDLLFIPAACPPYDGSTVITGAIIPIDEDTTGDVIATVQVVTVTASVPEATATPEILATEEVGTGGAATATATELVVPTITPTLAVTATATATPTETSVPTLSVEEITEEATAETTEETVEVATEVVEPDSDAVTVAPPVIGATATLIPTRSVTATSTVTIQPPVTTAEAAGDAPATPTPEVLSSSADITTDDGDANNLLQSLFSDASSAISGQ